LAPVQKKVAHLVLKSFYTRIRKYKIKIAASIYAYLIFSTETSSVSRKVSNAVIGVKSDLISIAFNPQVVYIFANTLLLTRAKQRFVTCA
jgi:hypothetical protein